MMLTRIIRRGLWVAMPDDLVLTVGSLMRLSLVIRADGILQGTFTCCMHLFFGCPVPCDIFRCWEGAPHMRGRVPRHGGLGGVCRGAGVQVRRARMLSSVSKVFLLCPFAATAANVATESEVPPLPRFPPPAARQLVAANTEHRRADTAVLFSRRAAHS